jgi:hypothetical protein
MAGIAIHRNNDSRTCGASTTAIGQSTVYINGELASVKDDTNTHGQGALTASNNDGSVWIAGKLVVLLDSGSQEDLLCQVIGPPHCNPRASSASPNVFACGGPKPSPGSASTSSSGSAGGSDGSGSGSSGSGSDGSSSDNPVDSPQTPRSDSDIVEIIETGRGYNIVRLADGSIVRQEGTLAWRNNNPGNLEYGPFARSQGAIGSDGRFAIFPSYEAGRQAKENLLFNTNSYRNLTISEAVSRYAPSVENNTGAYTNAITRSLGVSGSTPLSSLTSEQRTTMLNTMERVEGFRPGNVTTLGGTS